MPPQSSMTTVLALGATGLCGSAFVAAAGKSDAISKIVAFSRRSLAAAPKLEEVVDKDTASWGSKFPSADILWTSLSTTRGAAGGFDNQYKIDHTLNIELAKAAKAKGTKTIVIVTCSGASSGSLFPYLRMKGDIERDIIDIGFEKTIILRPGALIGEREENLKGFLNTLAGKVGSVLYDTPFGTAIGTPVYGTDVAAAGLDAALNAQPGVTIIESKDILQKAKLLSAK